MDAVFPLSAYAEDQQYPRAILTLHVLRAGLLASSVASAGTAALVTFTTTPRIPQLETPPSRSTYFVNRALVHSARGVPAGLFLTAGMLAFQMRDKTEIEWQDRSWRLLQNESQCAVDRWVVGGSAVGAAVVSGVLAARKGRIPSMSGMNGGMALVGGLGMGAAGGAAGCGGWWYGLRKRE